MHRKTRTTMAPTLRERCDKSPTRDQPVVDLVAVVRGSAMVASRPTRMNPAALRATMLAALDRPDAGVLIVSMLPPPGAR